MSPGESESSPFQHHWSKAVNDNLIHRKSTNILKDGYQLGLKGKKQDKIV